MAQGIIRDRALDHCGITKNQFYHKASNKKRGRKPSRTTKKERKEGVIDVKNSEVVNEIIKHLQNPLNKEGYQRMTGVLQLLGYYINHKKVYRLMKSNQLLCAPKIRASKKYVKYRILSPEGPLRLLEVDIKYVWVEGEQRHGYILTIIDVFTRVVLYWKVDRQMKQKAVEKAWANVIENHLEPHKMYGWKLDIEVRSDNGPQFSAKKIKKFLVENHLKQTFTHPYTPQENGHIESFHSILGDYLDDKYFHSLEDLEIKLITFYDHYNNNRVHGSTLKLPPKLFWEQWNLGNVARKVIDEKLRRVKFKLLIPRQKIIVNKPTGNMNQEVGLLPDLKNPNNLKSKYYQKDGAVLISQPTV